MADKIIKFNLEFGHNNYSFTINGSSIHGYGAFIADERDPVLQEVSRFYSCSTKELLDAVNEYKDQNGGVLWTPPE